jgi:RNA polymerase sigma-70 factor (ECF subfamily)
MQVASPTSVSPDFEYLFREHGRLVYRTAYAVLGNREDADDILQTVFLRLLRRETPPDLAKNPGAYLHRAAVNLSLDTLKTRRRQKTTAENAERVRVFADSADESPDDEKHRLLYDAIGQLNPKHAELLILRHVHNMSDAAIARMMGLSRAVIAVRLFRIRSRLKQLVKKALEENS